MSDLKKREQSTANVAPGDLIWKFEKLTPESPKKDGRAEAYLRKIGKAPKEYICTTLVATTEGGGNTCSVCQQQKATRFCRLIKNNGTQDTSICADCINVFTEYNPNAVFDLEIKKPN